MDDLIRRSDIFDLLDNWDSETVDKDAFYCDVEDISSAREWILCSERLPEIYEKVLTTAKGDRVRENFRLNTKNVEWSYGTERSVIAWMPLPEPWEGEQDG